MRKYRQSLNGFLVYRTTISFNCKTKKVVDEVFRIGGIVVKLLIIDADNRVESALAMVAGNRNWEIERAVCAREGLGRLDSDCDFVIINDLLPDSSGLEVLSELRQKDELLPVVMYSGQCPAEQRIEAFAQGVDDYLQKPFAVEELAARIEAINRRAARGKQQELSFGDLILDRHSFELICGDEKTYLSMKEYQVLELLLESGGQAVKREKFLQQIWGQESQAEYNSVEVYISFVRKKIAQLHSAVSIKTLRGYGHGLAIE